MSSHQQGKEIKAEKALPWQCAGLHRGSLMGFGSAKSGEGRGLKALGSQPTKVENLGVKTPAAPKPAIPHLALS